METFIIAFLFFGLYMFRINCDILFFQQNSYNNRIHLKWLIHHPKRYIVTILLLIYSGLDFWLTGLPTWLSVGLWILAVLNLIPKNRPIKPMVWTPRARRLLTTSAVIIVIFTYFASPHIAWLFFAYACIPFVLPLANLINSPIETMVRNKYIKEAQQIINSYPDLIVIGITGSYGKTSFKNFLGALLSTKYNVLVTPKNYNTTMGVVKTIRENLKATHKIFICEMGATHPGDINEICEIVKPKIGVLTGIAPIHLETFKTMETLIATKLELAKFVKTLYYNADNELLNEAVTYGNAYSLNDFPNISTSVRGSKFGPYTTALIGNSNLQNLFGAIKLATTEFKFRPSDIKNALKNIRTTEHRQELKTINESTTIIDDAYNSNPVGSAAALDTLAMWKNDYKILITPGMIDLGPQQYDANYKFGEYACKNNAADEIVLVGEIWTKPIVQALKDNNFANYKIFNTTRAAIAYATGLKINQHKTILIENDLPDNYQ